MMPADLAASLLNRIESARADLGRAERRVAEVVCAKPRQILENGVAGVARAAQVSEPTVVRFCRSMGFGGFRDFQIGLAGDLATTAARDGHAAPHGAEVGPSVAHQVLEATRGSLARLDREIDPVAIERAARAFLEARRVDCYGLGVSGTVAIDAHHKLLRLGIACNAYADTHMQALSAATLTAADAVLAISASGRTREILESVAIARASGARIVALSAPGSPLLASADLAVAITTSHADDFFTPMTSRIVQLVAIDILAVTAARLRPWPEAHTSRINTVLHEKRLGRGTHGRAPRPSPDRGRGARRSTLQSQREA